MSVRVSEDIVRIVNDIQSVGRNCEYGIIQRREFRAEPLSLLRWAGSRQRDKLVDAFRNRFAGLADEMTGRGDPPGAPPDFQHWWLVDSRYDILFHTDVLVSTATLEQARQKVHARLRRAAEMQIEAIEDADKLFLYSDATLGSAHEARSLFEALRAIGPCWLVVVIPDKARAGQAELLADGLIGGYVAHLTTMGNATQYDYASWPAMLADAHRIWRERR